MYILIAFARDSSSFSMAVMSDLRMLTRCNALAAKDVISVVIPTHSIFTFFLFLTFSIISLHSAAAKPLVFARIRRLRGCVAQSRD